MQQNENAPTSPNRLEERLGAAVAFAGAAFVVASIILSSTTMTGCGPCWPGPCADAQPTTSATPTPTPTVTPTSSGDDTPQPLATCGVNRQRGLIDDDLWQADSTECPRLLLDSSDVRYESADLCESGVRVDGSDTAFYFRYTCNASEPWQIAVANVDVDNGETTLERLCPDSLTVTETFINGKDLETLLWNRRQDDITAVATSFSESCTTEGLSQETLDQCELVCKQTDDDVPQKSLYAALNDLGMLPEDAEVACYLKLYEVPPLVVGQTIESDEGNLVFSSLCGCVPTGGFASCLEGDSSGDGCFSDIASYDSTCGQDCWQNNASDSEDCTTVEF